MKKPSPKTVRYVYMAALLLGALIIFLGIQVERRGVCAAGTAVVLLAMAGHIVFSRCPHCGRYLGRAWGDHCPYCGKPFDGE